MSPELARIGQILQRKIEPLGNRPRIHVEPARIEHRPELENAHAGVGHRKPAHQIRTGVLAADDHVRRFIDDTLEAVITLGSVGDREELRPSLVLEVGDPSDPRHR